MQSRDWRFIKYLLAHRKKKNEGPSIIRMGKSNSQGFLGRCWSCKRVGEGEKNEFKIQP